MLRILNLSRRGYKGINYVATVETIFPRHVNKEFSNLRFITNSCPGKKAAQTESKSQESCPAHGESGVGKQGTGDSEWDARCHVNRATWEAAKPFSEMPGPRPLPVFGNTWRFLPVIGEFHGLEVNEFLEIVRQKYGIAVRLERILGLDDAVYLMCPSEVELVYKQESISPERDILGSMTYFRSKFRQEVFKDAKGLVTSNGYDWYHFRNKVNAIMMQPKMVKQYIKPVDIIAKDFVDKIKRIRGPDNKVGDVIMNEVNKWALETIAALALDQRLGCLADDLPADSTTQYMINNAQAIFSIGEKLDFEPSIWRYVSTPTYRKAMKLYDDQLNLAQTHINIALERIQSQKGNDQVSEDGEKKEASVLEKLLDIDPKVAVVMATDMMFAGIDTTSTALVNILYHLSKNSTKQEKLREEIYSILPDKNAELKAEHLNQMPYLKACIKEAARIYPVTPGTMRNLTKDTVLSGYRVPKGTKIFFNHMYISVQDTQFPEPKEFIPERWLRENIETEYSYKRAHPFASMHFGFGARSCIGRRFAELELDVGIINFIRNFEISWEGKRPKKVTTSINYLKGPFGFIFKDKTM